MKFNRKCKVLHLKRNSLRHQYVLGNNGLERCLAKKTLGVLVEPILIYRLFFLVCLF